MGQGIGIQLDGEPVGSADDGSGPYLATVDLDDVFRNEETQAVVMKLAAEVRSYLELSSIGRSLRIL